MGLDLTLLPFDSPIFSHTVLSVHRDRTLFARIQELSQGLVPEPFDSYLSYHEMHGICYGSTTTTAYGHPLTFVQACQLTDLVMHPGVQIHQKNRAVWAYLQALPPDQPVALYWD